MDRFLFFTLILSLTVALVFLGPPFSSLVSLNYSFEDIITQEKLAREGQNSSKDIRRNAEEWVKNHQALVDGWLEEARIAGKASK